MSHPTQADMDAAEALWGRKTRRKRGCTCCGVDIGVGTMHEPGCGDPRPEDVAVLLAAARTEGARLALERAAEVCDKAAEGWRSSGYLGRAHGADGLAMEIRALSPAALAQGGAP